MKCLYESLLKKKIGVVSYQVFLHRTNAQVKYFPQCFVERHSQGITGVAHILLECYLLLYKKEMPINF